MIVSKSSCSYAKHQGLVYSLISISHELAMARMEANAIFHTAPPQVPLDLSNYQKLLYIHPTSLPRHQ